MFTGSAKELTDLSRRFTEPANATHRQYEALRAYFVEGLSGVEAARRFGYTAGSFRVLVHQFRRDPDRAFFIPPAKGPRAAPKADPLRDRIVELRKQNLSIYAISRALHDEGRPLGPVAVSQVLKAEGFARLPQRADDERPPGPRPTAANVADVRRLDLTPRQLRTRFAGLFLFFPTLPPLPLDPFPRQPGLPAPGMIRPGGALRSLLALKLFGAARHPHVMSAVLDEGLALFAGLNVIPKRSFLTEYSCRIDPACYPKLMRLWFDAMSGLGLERGKSFDLDFHTIPYHGDDPLVDET